MSRTGPTSFRNVQITGEFAKGDVTSLDMDEGTGALSLQTPPTTIFRSTNGGGTWTNSYIGTPFSGPGSTAVGYFACMFLDGGGYCALRGRRASFPRIMAVVHYVLYHARDPAAIHVTSLTSARPIRWGRPL